MRAQTRFWSLFFECLTKLYLTQVWFWVVAGAVVLAIAFGPALAAGIGWSVLMALSLILIAITFIGYAFDRERPESLDPTPIFHEPERELLAGTTRH